MPSARPISNEPIWVASAMPGTEDLLEEEIRRRLSGRVRFLPGGRADERHFLCAARPSRLRTLALCHALFIRKDFPVVRPRGLLSPEHLRALVEQVRGCLAMAPAERFTGLRFDAAGSGSPTFRRLGEALAAGLGLPFAPTDGDCLLTVRPGGDGWQVLCRIGNRPLSARPWRTAHYRGSLNANLAAAMVELSRPARGDRFLNAMCGSGTILIERLHRADLRCAWGVDDSALALEAARTNSRCAGLADRVALVRADGRDLPFAAGSFDVVCADLPWGEAHGRRADNTALYRGAFAQARRVCRADGRLVVLTQDRQALAALAEETGRWWTLVEERTFVQRGFRPACRVYVGR